MLMLIAKFWCKLFHARPMWPIHGCLEAPIFAAGAAR